MASPQTVTQITMGMAERYEIVIDFAAITAGQKIQLVNGGVNNAVDYDHTGKIMQFEVTGRPRQHPTTTTCPPSSPRRTRRCS